MCTKIILKKSASFSKRLISTHTQPPSKKKTKQKKVSNSK